jgi:membrane fusion protein, multidrug efflux system
MRKGVIAALAVVMAVAAAVLGYVFEAPAPATAAQKPRVAAPVPVTPGTVRLADVPVLLNGIGTVQAFNTVTVKSRVDGPIVGVQFTEGEEVKAGAPLFKLDPRSYQAALDQAEAALEKDRAAFANAQLNLGRDAQVLQSHLAISQQQYDTDKATVAADKAQVDGDKAQVETARLNLGYTDIRAPIGGRLGARLVDIGNLVHASDAGGLVTISQLRPIYVSFTLPQEHIDEIREEQAKAPLTIDAYSSDGKRSLATGKLSLIDNEINQATGTIHLKAVFANRDERLWPGEFVNVRMILKVRRGVATVPAETVQEGPEGHYAYVIRKDDTVERRAVEVAAVQDGIAVITKGLKPGERVVVDGQYRLTEGARVRLLPPKPGAAG